MSPFAVCAFAVLAVLAVSAVKRLNPELASVAVAVAGTVIFVYIAESLVPFVRFIKSSAESVGTEGYFSLMLKALAISLCCKMSADICRDCGESLLASRVELAGKVGIVLLSLPIVTNLLEIAKDLI